VPHSGEFLSLTGTLRRDGLVSRRDNSLVTDGTVLDSAILLEDGTNLLLEDGTSLLTET
jgi:hypothetical protein